MKDIDPIERSIIRLADRLDEGAESRNWHEFVGKHRALAAILSIHIDTTDTLKILRSISRRGGLDQLTPEQLGIDGPWRDWVLPRAKRKAAKE